MPTSKKYTLSRRTLLRGAACGVGAAVALPILDAMGVWRDTDHGMPIDDTGQYGGQTFQGEIGLGAMLRDHPALEPCLVQALYGVGVGHLATEFDRAAFTSLVHDFGANGARVRGLLSAIVASDGFRYLPKAM